MTKVSKEAGRMSTDCGFTESAPNKMRQSVLMHRSYLKCAKDPKGRRGSLPSKVNSSRQSCK
jgi:hypothetical protein